MAFRTSTITSLLLTAAAVVTIGVVVHTPGAVELMSRAAGTSSSAASDRTSGIGPEDGYVDGLLTVADTDEPAISRLDPRLLDALRQASRDAAADGVRLTINSGWRSRAYQQHLFDAAIAQYGSPAAARRWVGTPATSHHVTGDAVDIGRGAVPWVDEHGSRYGLCQVYADEPWHYELLTRPGGLCPRPLPDGAS